jgi:cell division protein FtsW (lipid II flippase)
MTDKMQYLPDAQTEFIFSLSGRAIDGVLALMIATVVGTVLLLAGLALLR